MDIIARFGVYEHMVKNDIERNLFNKFNTDFKDYIHENTEACKVFYIPMSVSGCKELLQEVLAIEACYDSQIEECFVHAWIPDKKFTKKDHANAVAYLVLWGSFVYTNDDLIGTYCVPCCENSQWYDGGKCVVQIGSYRISKSLLKNKKYAITDQYDYVVDDDLKKVLLTCGAAQEDFFPVLSKGGELVCWQLTPQNMLTGLGDINGWEKIKGCLNCGKETYLVNDYDFYWMSKETFEQLNPLNKSTEVFGRSFQPDIIVNKDVYIALKKECPRMQFEPIFLKE